MIIDFPLYCYFSKFGVRGNPGSRMGTYLLSFTLLLGVKV